MAAQRHHLDLHVGEQRQRRQQRVQLVDAADVEDADVGVLAGDAPQVAPLALFLQALGEAFSSASAARPAPPAWPGAG
jgi:hypothetical protein